MKKKIKIEYSFDNTGAIKTEVDMREIVFDVLVVLRAALNGLTERGLMVASYSGISEKDVESYLRTITIKDLYS